MCIAIMDTHIWMEVRIAWMLEYTSDVAPSIVESAMCRGMLAAPKMGSTREPSGAPEVRQGGDNTARGGVSRRTEYGADAGEAGTSYTRVGGASGSRVAGGDSGSDSG